MTIRAAIHHVTHYQYDRPIMLGGRAVGRAVIRGRALALAALDLREQAIDRRLDLRHRTRVEAHRAVGHLAVRSHDEHARDAPHTVGVRHGAAVVEERGEGGLLRLDELQAVAGPAVEVTGDPRPTTWR